MKELKYYRLIQDLREQMASGRFHTGDKLPSENELASTYQISRQTVRKALSILENEGSVHAVHGKGTFCSKANVHTHASKNIAVVTTYLSDYIFPRVIQGIDNVLTQRGYSIILKNTGNSRSKEAQCLEELLQKDIDGVIIEPSKSQIYCRHTNLYEQLEAYNIPYVFIQGCFAQMQDKYHVLMDDCKGGYMITQFLVSLGHRRIIGVFKADDMQGHNRHKGYVQALQEAGILYDPDLVIWFHTEDRTFHPYESIKKMVDDKIAMDAVVCYNDQIAVSVVRALQEKGLRIPEDVSVTGYDNFQMTSFDGLRLTTVVHPQEKLGEIAAELLVDLIENRENTENKCILIDPVIEFGNSCSIKKAL